MRKNMKDMVEEIRNDEIEIFGQHKTREEIKAEKKARKAAERKALREAAKARRVAAVQSATPSTRRDIIVTAVAVLLILVVGIGALALQFIPDADADAFEVEEGRTYFANESAVPDEVEDGVGAALTQAYYTKGGYLCVRLLLGNATEHDMRIETIDILLYNNTDTIASAKLVGPTESDSDEPFVISADANRYYEFYISPEHIFLKDDPLSEVGYTATIESTPLESEE